MQDTDPTHTGSRRKGLHVTLHSSPYFWETHSRLFEHLVLIAYFCNKNMKIFFQNGLKLVCFEILEISTHKREKKKSKKRERETEQQRTLRCLLSSTELLGPYNEWLLFILQYFFAGQKTISQSAPSCQWTTAGRAGHGTGQHKPTSKSYSMICFRTACSLTPGNPTESAAATGPEGNLGTVTAI